MDGITRRNAGTAVGEYVKLRKAKVKEAKRVVLAPAESGIIIHTNAIYYKKNLLGRPVTKGDIIIPLPTFRRRRPDGTYVDIPLRELLRSVEEQAV